MLHVESRSGGLRSQPPRAAQVQTGWLGRDLESDDAREFGDDVVPEAEIETAVGVLMEYRGWDATKARSRLDAAAAAADVAAHGLARAVLALVPENPK